MNDIMDVVKVLFIIGFIVFLAGSCSDGENQKMESKIKEAMEEGYSRGYDVGYERGAEDQREKDFREYTIDTRSIYDIVNMVYDEYGMTPSEAFGIYDEYTYDSSHGGFTWAEYQKAIEVMYYTASIFPAE